MLCAESEAIDHPGVAEAQGPDDLWAEGNLGHVLSEMDRTGGTPELHSASPAAALSLGVSEVRGLESTFLRGCRAMGLELGLWFSFLLCLELADDSWQA